jgi:fructokinase
MVLILAAVEGGGTTWVCAIAHDDPTNIVERAEFPTTTPAETLGKCCDWLRTRTYDALGVATFGPVDLNKSSPTYGYITTTPKPGWKNTDVLGPLCALRKVPFLFDTDVNAPALAEFLEMQREGHKGSSCAYITVGTGIGIGLVVNGQPVHGLMHPEGGHVAVPRHTADGSFAGSNPKDCFGGLCAENMACSVALAQRAGLSDTSGLATLPDDHPVWEAAGHYLGALCANLTLLVSPERIVLSGGVMLRKTLFPSVRANMQKHLNGYLQLPAVLDAVDTFIVPSKHGNKAGMVGAMTLALQAAKGKPKGLPIVGDAPGWQLALLGAAAGAAVGLVLGRAMR